MQIVKLTLAGLAAFSCSAAETPAGNEPAATYAPEPGDARAVEIDSRCGVLADRTPDGLILQPYADPGLGGQFRFRVWMNSPDGSADIEQSGDLDPSSSSVLGEINVDPDANWRATLDITGKNGATLCSADGAAG